MNGGLILTDNKKSLREDKGLIFTIIIWLFNMTCLIILLIFGELSTYMPIILILFLLGILVILIRFVKVISKKAKKTRQIINELKDEIFEFVPEVYKVKLYMQPTKLMAVPNFINDIDEAAISLAKTIDENAIISTKGLSYYSMYCEFLVPSIKVYGFIKSKKKGYSGKPKNIVTEITLEGPEEEVKNFARGIIAILDRLPWENVKWKKIEKAFKVKREECIEKWKEILDIE